jgi:hypothetical protein
MRLGRRAWDGGHEAWSELAIYVKNCARLPRVLQRRRDLDWLGPVFTGD